MKEELYLKENGTIVGLDLGNTSIFLILLYHSLALFSVTWVVEELILEYASQIEDHMNRIASVIQNNHWRTNPSVLSGMRVAVFRKSTGSFPTVITG
mmetsp:Transcript_30237/g.32955  ORF Transcript_30237/g.32955 Transcript_30237/m.32955 type:complete len:97 (-) Transcript_30237:60-350(-)